MLYHLFRSAKMAQKFPDFDLPEVKRFTLNGVVLKAPCPTCKKELTWDGGEDYLQFPCNGGEYTIAFWCTDCEEEHNQDYRFDFELTVTPCNTTGGS